MTRSIFSHTIRSILGFVIILSLFPTSSYAYLKIDPPPDVDKTGANATCWLATAANMLAGAGYGEISSGSSDLQTRADYIYGELVTQFGTST